MAGSLEGGGVRVDFDNEFPTGISWSKTADWTAVSPISRACPVLGYASSSSAQVSFTIRFSIEEGPVMKRVKDLRSLVYPKGYRPPAMTIKIEGWVDMPCVIESISDVVPDDAAWIGDEPSVCDVSVTCKEYI